MWKPAAVGTSVCWAAARSDHGGPVYERLVSKGELILQLHAFESEHDHGPIGDRHSKPYGNGVLLWFETDDFEAIAQRAAEMAIEFIFPRLRNPPNLEDVPSITGECWMRDPDGIRRR